MAIEDRIGIGEGVVAPADTEGWCPACQADHEPPWYDIGETCERKVEGK